jgi:hypothetical protein
MFVSIDQWSVQVSNVFIVPTCLTLLIKNLKGEKRRNIGKLNNELNIVNQLVDLHFLFVNITGN